MTKQYTILVKQNPDKTVSPIDDINKSVFGKWCSRMFIQNNTPDKGYDNYVEAYLEFYDNTWNNIFRADKWPAASELVYTDDLKQDVVLRIVLTNCSEHESMSEDELLKEYGGV